MWMSEQTLSEGKELRFGVRNNYFMTPFWRRRHTFVQIASAGKP